MVIDCLDTVMDSVVGLVVDLVEKCMGVMILGVIIVEVTTDMMILGKI
jgi:hypothetical protein